MLLAEAGYTVTGIDFSRGMLVTASRKAADAGVAVTFRTGDASAPDLEPKSVDAIVVRHVTWALPAPADAIRRWAGLLRPGGRLVLVEGRWSTGAGLTARTLTEARPPGRPRHRSATADRPALWAARSPTSATHWSRRREPPQGRVSSYFPRSGCLASLESNICSWPSRRARRGNRESARDRACARSRPAPAARRSARVRLGTSGRRARSQRRVARRWLRRLRPLGPEHCRVPHGVARATVDLARTFSRFPKPARRSPPATLAAACRDDPNACTPERLDAIVDVESALVDAARVASPRELRGIVQRVADAVDGDGGRATANEHTNAVACTCRQRSTAWSRSTGSSIRSREKSCSPRSTR